MDPRKKSSQLPTLTTVSMAGLVADAASYGRWWYGWPSCPGRTGCAGRHANSSHRHPGRARCTGRHTWGDTHHAGTTRSGWSWVGEPRDPSGQRFFLCDKRNSMNMDLTMICNFAKYCYQILLNHISNTDEYLNLDPNRPMADVLMSTFFLLYISYCTNLMNLDGYHIIICLHPSLIWINCSWPRMDPNAMAAAMQAQLSYELRLALDITSFWKMNWNKIFETLAFECR